MGEHSSRDGAWFGDLRGEPYAYLTTIGRVTGDPHEIEIWFAVHRATVYLLAERRDDADWVRNLRREPNVVLRIAGRTTGGRARVVDADSDEDAHARHLVWGKYAGSDHELTRWRDTALPVAVDLAD